LVRSFFESPAVSTRRSSQKKTNKQLQPSGQNRRKKQFEGVRFC